MINSIVTASIKKNLGLQTKNTHMNFFFKCTFCFTDSTHKSEKKKNSHVSRVQSIRILQLSALIFFLSAVQIKRIFVSFSTSCPRVHFYKEITSPVIFYLVFVYLRISARSHDHHNCHNLITSEKKSLHFTTEPSHKTSAKLCL